MKLILTNQTGGYDVTQQVQKVTLSGDYQQCARILELSMLIQSCQRTNGRHHPHNQAWESLVFQNGDHPQTYKVASGDTLWGICRKFYSAPTLCWKLAKYNGIQNANLIYPGQILKIPEKKELG